MKTPKLQKKLGSYRAISNLSVMISDADCAAVVPCLDEAATISDLVASIRRYALTVLVVDDGSTDATAALAKARGAEVIQHSSPQGKAAALISGWRWLHEHGVKWALSLDGDGQHSPEDIPAFLNNMRRGTDLVVGNRMNDAESIPRIRRFVNRWMSKSISNLAGCSLPDSQCGFRLMNLNAWAQLEIAAMHFQIESEVLLAFARAGLGIQFVPIRVLYNNERSKIRPFKDTVRWFDWWLRARRGAKSDRLSPKTAQSHVPDFLASRIVRAPK